MKLKNILLITLLAIIQSSYAQNPSIQLVDAFPNLTFTSPLHLTHSNDGTNRIFIVQQNGKIIVFPNDSNVSQNSANTFLDVTNKISPSGGELGLLGLAFHPDFSSNGYFYINYTAVSPLRTVISRFKVIQGNPNKADSLSEYKILEINQPFSNHNGGTVMFGLDGYLYIGMGDGGSSGDPQNNAQNPQSLLGKMLRIDINDTTATRRYVIPQSNPFYNNPSSGREEIYSWGFRNPWKFSQDPVTGLIYAADVGQNTWEEIDILKNGKNYGWKVMEGFACFDPPTGCDTTGKEKPIKVYDHSAGSCSITGGYVYRGNRRPELQGAYIYGDYCNGRIWMLRYNNGTVTSDSLLTISGLLLGSFGTDQNNELYVLNTASVNGKIFRFNRSTSSGIGNENEIPSGFELQQNYPNPFNAGTVIKYSIPKNGAVRLTLYNTRGEKVETLVNSYQKAGNYSIAFAVSGKSSSRLSSGVYFYRLEAGDFSQTRRMIFLK